MCNLEHIDLRNQLKRSKTVKQVSRTVTKFVTVHWNGPAVLVSEIEQIKRDALFHVNDRGWDGLSYHYVIGQSGTIYWCRDTWARLAHSGVEQGNNESYAILMLVGEEQLVTPLALHTLKALILDLNIQPRYILGHQEWPRDTECPGPLLNQWLTDYRSNYEKPGKVKTIVNANIRATANVRGKIIGTAKYGNTYSGTWILGEPVRGDSQWLKINIGNNKFGYLHASTLQEV